MPDAELVATELAKAKDVDDFFGKDGIFARMFGKTIETMLVGRNGRPPWLPQALGKRLQHGQQPERYTEA